MADSSSIIETKTLDHFYPSIQSKEPNVRLDCFSKLEDYLSDENNSIECEDLAGFINGLLKWVESSNYRISYNGLRIVEQLLERLDSYEFESYLENVSLVTLDRFGDGKDQIREAASHLLLKLMKAFTPQRIWDFIQPVSFENKQFRIREEIQRLLVQTLNKFGASTIQLNKLVPLICKLVSDSNGNVRQQAIDTLVEIYRHVGEKVRGDIAKRDIPEAKLKQLYDKFDDVVASGRMIAKTSDTTDGNSSSSIANARPKPPPSTIKSRLNSDNGTSSRSRPAGGIPTRNVSASMSAAAASGAVDEAIFEDAFNSSHPIPFSSSKELENQLFSIRDILADTNNDWEKRVDAIKRLRSIIASEGDQSEEFFRNLRQLDLPLVATVKDLRSQIVREACITLAYMSVRFTNRFERTAEGVIPAMLVLIQNSAKVISTSGAVALRYIVSNTQASKLVPLILAGTESKSKDIRRHTFELLVTMLSQWDFVYLDKHGQLIHNIIKKGLSDADADARSLARKAFGLFRDLFPLLADALLSSLDAAKKKTLLGEMSNSSSTHSLASTGTSRIRSAKEMTPRLARAAITDKQQSPGAIARSSSANELALRKKNHLTNLNTPNVQTTTGRPRFLAQAAATTTSVKASSVNARPPHVVSQSQPGSRSTSPNSMKSSHYLSAALRTPTNTRSKIPVGSSGGSRISSRESSPGRTPVSARGVGSGNKRRFGRPYGGYRAPGSDYGEHVRRVSGAWGADSGDDASETSSICSERSLEDIADVLRRMQSNEWTDRKESLASLYHMIRSGRTFSTHELKRLTELLTKRFYDPHSQVFTAFLDVLPEFISAYKRELNEWLYTLLTRLLIRLGAPDLLDSVYKKLKTCLSIVNTSFDVHAQFTVLIRFINDNSSAPGIKAKEILLKYLQQIIQQMEPVDISNNADIRIALSKIINWSSEPKSIEMRKAAQGVILALYNLNRPEFTLMLTALPSTYQDAAAKILRPTNSMQSSIHSQHDNKFDFLQRSNSNALTSSMTSSIHSEIQAPSYATDMRVLMENMQALNVNHRQDDLLLSSSSSLKDSGYQDTRSNSSRHYTPQAYRSNQSQSNATETSDSILDAADRPAAIDVALNMANQQTLGKDQRQHALRCILKFAKLNDSDTWSLAFSKTLNILTQILDNEQDDIIYKVYSLRIIRELLTHHTSLFMNYIELTIFRVLKAQSETESEITRSAEQAAHAAAEYLPAESTVRVLKPIIEQAKYPMNQSAIAMLQKTIELMNKETCTELMPEMIPALLTVWDIHSHNLTGGESSWDSETSSVRKAAVFCLVSIYLVVGDSLRTHLHRLSASKLKLLNVYISKAQQQTSNISNLEKSSTMSVNSNRI
ncbi:unnamed protein product [Rotaria magnacalcarata]|uniref:TOG domain-containing protein n=2 Tax=Rotaria magnacalcarata TaxID=392030 RepID=A0A817AZD3_9BILA|nr:unnamed protein product [Rotaria magnacalcarata]CAF1390244.1 unnamed protein product [Rotaria magnacalcarata]CAF2123974.1 unnamed protein product [Rotaria magnacalcarata]CAF2232737.1 unnamed protein product [Rotaria magnacalcarata]CAF2269520.1 unnamed protein product [Rotaria magnacalcarata]